MFDIVHSPTVRISYIVESLHSKNNYLVSHIVCTPKATNSQHSRQSNTKCTKCCSQFARKSCLSRYKKHSCWEKNSLCSPSTNTLCRLGVPRHCDPKSRNFVHRKHRIAQPKHSHSQCTADSQRSRGCRANRKIPFGSVRLRRRCNDMRILPNSQTLRTLNTVRPKYCSSDNLATNCWNGNRWCIRISVPLSERSFPSHYMIDKWDRPVNRKCIQEESQSIGNNWNHSHSFH